MQKDRPSPAGKLRSSSKGGASPSGLKKAAKLVLLVGAMICIGFFAVLVIDVGASLVGKVKLGETSVVELWQKVADRVLDRDVPRTDPRVTRASAQSSSSSPPPSHASRPSSSAANAAPAERAPLPAVRPEEDAKHVDVPAKGTDPQVQKAKQRLDDLLGRL